jgi:hypothetical protein
MADMGKDGTPVEEVLGKDGRWHPAVGVADAGHLVEVAPSTVASTDELGTAYVKLGMADAEIARLKVQVAGLQAANTAEVERRRAAEAMAPPPETRHAGRLLEAWKVCGQLVLPELDRAWSSFPRPQASLHESWGVLLEESDELWDEIKKRRPELGLVRKEARQVAAMAVRLIVELCHGVAP